MKVIYLAGKITGNPDYKREFNQMENRLQVKGYTVLNPAHLPEGLSPAQYMRICFAMIDDADAVLLLPNWQKSPGAQLEADYCLYTRKNAYLSIDALLAEGVK